MAITIIPPLPHLVHLERFLFNKNKITQISDLLAKTNTSMHSMSDICCEGHNTYNTRFV